MKKLYRFSLMMIVLLAMVGTAFAQEPLSVDIYGPGQRLVYYTLFEPQNLGGGAMTPLAAKFIKEVQNDLSFLPFMEPQSASQLLGGGALKGVKAGDIDFKPLQLAKIDLVMTTGWKGNNLEVRVFETFSQRMMVGKAYGNVTDESVTRIADRICSLILQSLTGKKGFFESPIAFVRQLGKSKEIYTTLPQGRDLKRITRLGGFNLSPAWSPDGSRIVFSHIGDKKHFLGEWDKSTGQARLVQSNLGQTVISPDYMPNGRVVVTLNRYGHSDIYQLKADYTIDKPLVDSRFIDVSPSFDRSGNLMAFTSGRAGNPHIYLMDMRTGQTRRVTINGKYNTHPCLSPDGRYIAYTHQTADGHRIFVYDLQTNLDRQITFGPGNDEYPAFGPDGYFVAFASNRSGEYKLYLTTRHGDTPKMIPSGDGPAFAPAWETSPQ